MTFPSRIFLFWPKKMFRKTRMMAGKYFAAFIPFISIWSTFDPLLTILSKSNLHRLVSPLSKIDLFNLSFLVKGVVVWEKLSLTKFT